MKPRVAKSLTMLSLEAVIPTKVSQIPQLKSNQIKAAIFIGDPRYIYGLPYDVGTCTAEGVSSFPNFFSAMILIKTNKTFKFAPRPAGFVCLSASKIKSYCDASDPYCCNGDDAATYQGYGAEYGAAAFAFIQSQLSAAGSGTTGTSGTISTKASTTTTTISTGTTSAVSPCF
jgi:acetylxylan esterase